MKVLLSIVAIILFGFIGQSSMPWWIIVLIVGLITAGMGLKTGGGFIAGFLGLALLWLGYATYLNSANEGIMAAKIGNLFGGFGSITMLFFTFLLGGILGGLAGITGSLARSLIEPTEQ